MSDLEDIAAEAQIAIVGSPPNDGGDAVANASDGIGGSSVKSSLQAATASGDSGDLTNIETLNALFSHRYTDEDPDFLKTVEMAEVWSRPPCVEDFFVRRQRDDNRRHRGGGRGSYHHRGSGDRSWRGRRDDFHGDRNRYHGNRGGWGGGDRRDQDSHNNRGYNSYREGSSGYNYRHGGRDRSPHR